MAHTSRGVPKCHPKTLRTRTWRRTARVCIYRRGGAAGVGAAAIGGGRGGLTRPLAGIAGPAARVFRTQARVVALVVRPQVVGRFIFKRWPPAAAAARINIRLYQSGRAPPPRRNRVSLCVGVCVRVCARVRRPYFERLAAKRARDDTRQARRRRRRYARDIRRSQQVGRRVGLREYCYCYYCYDDANRRSDRRPASLAGVTRTPAGTSFSQPASGPLNVHAVARAGRSSRRPGRTSRWVPYCRRRPV